MHTFLKIVCCTLVFLLNPYIYSATIQSSRKVTSIGFGSCLNPTKSFEVLKTIGERKPDLFLMLGDITYSDTISPIELARDYQKLKAHPKFRFFKKRTSRFIGVWDDHDYGLNDMGSDHPNKEQMKEVFWDLYERPYNTILKQRNGVFQSLISGTGPFKLQVIILDTRYNRTGLKQSRDVLSGKVGNVPNTDSNAQVLGEEQWSWLQKELSQNVDLRIIVSSIQVINKEHHFEKWQNFPKERERLLEMIKSNLSVPTLLLTGDRHFHELSNMKLDSNSSLYEFTSSGLNVANPKSGTEKNLHRIRSSNANGFGWIDVNWQDRVINLSFVEENGKSSEWLSKPFSKLNSYLNSN